MSSAGLRRIELAGRIQPSMRIIVNSDRAFPADRQLRFRGQQLSTSAAVRTADVHAAVSAAVHACRDEVQTGEGHAPCRCRIPPDGSADDDGPVLRHLFMRHA